MRPTADDSVVLPSGAELLGLERRVRRDGSGLVVADLDGTWQLRQLWPRGGDRPAAFTALLLRGLQARLEIRAAGNDLLLCNAVTLGPLELCFRGPGWLSGRRPLLQFLFRSLEISLAGRPLLCRTLADPPARRLPFFALIARHPHGWLAARGRGGGLALWQRS